MPEKVDVQPSFEIKSIGPIELKADMDNSKVKGYGAIFGNVDAGGDIIEKGAFKNTIKERFPDNVKYYDQHRCPIGRFDVLKEDAKGLYFEASVSPTTVGKDHMILVNDGVINQASIGYRATKVMYDEEQTHQGWPIRHLLELDLFEVSGLPFGMNDETSVSPKGFEPYLRDAIRQEVKNALEEKSVVPFKDLPIGDRALAWSRSEAEGRVRTWAGASDVPNAKFRSAFVWYDSENAENFGAYKLMIADVIEGVLTAIPRAVFAAAGALQGARGGVNIPDEDRGKARKHISRYYAKMRRQFEDDNLQAPWEKSALILPPDKGDLLLQAAKMLQEILSVDIGTEEDVLSPEERLQKRLEALTHKLRSL